MTAGTVDLDERTLEYLSEKLAKIKEVQPVFDLRAVLNTDDPEARVERVTVDALVLGLQILTSQIHIPENTKSVEKFWQMVEVLYRYRYE